MISLWPLLLVVEGFHHLSVQVGILLFKYFEQELLLHFQRECGQLFLLCLCVVAEVDPDIPSSHLQVRHLLS